MIRVICGLVLVKELTLHLPITHVEPPLRPTAQTSSIRPVFARERPAKIEMPATKHPRYKIAKFSSQRLHDVYLSKSTEVSSRH